MMFRLFKAICCSRPPVLPNRWSRLQGLGFSSFAFGTKIPKQKTKGHSHNNLSDRQPQDAPDLNLNHNPTLRRRLKKECMTLKHGATVY